jgi:hypothetical protein
LPWALFLQPFRLPKFEVRPGLGLREPACESFHVVAIDYSRDPHQGGIALRGRVRVRVCLIDS